jgi:flagellar hook protein FlgE
MSGITSIGLSGLQAAQQQLGVSANNIANANTVGYRREVIDSQALAGGGVNGLVSRADQAGPQLEQDVVTQMSAQYQFDANLKTIKTQDQMLGSLLHIQA